MDLTSIISTYLEHPNKHLFINRYDGSTIAVTESELAKAEKGFDPWNGKIAHMEDYFPYYYRRRDFIVDIRASFLKKHKLSKDIDASLVHSSPKFNAMIKKRGLWDQYVEYYIDENCATLADLLYCNEVEDIEASPSQYKAIGKLLKEYESYRFWEHFSDSNYFTVVNSPNKGSDFIVMGNGGSTYGISFYRGHQEGREGYCLLYHDSQYNDPDLTNTIGTLGCTVSFYCDQEKEEGFEYDVSPYDSDPRYWSISVMRGKMKRNYLGKTMARSIEYQLREAIQVLKGLLTQERPEHLPDYDADIVAIYGIHDYIYRIMPRDYDPQTPPLILDSYLYRHLEPDINPRKSSKAVLSFVFRAVPEGVFHEENEPRFAFHAYVGILCDEESGIIVAPIFVSSEDTKRPFIINLLNAAGGPLSNLASPKEVLVNSEFDYQMAEFLFAPMLREGTLLTFEDSLLAADDAYHSMAEELHKSPAKA